MIFKKVFREKVREAYMQEIKIADELGLKDVSAQLWENYRQEREYILNFFKEWWKEWVIVK